MELRLGQALYQMLCKIFPAATSSEPEHQQASFRTFYQHSLIDQTSNFASQLDDEAQNPTRLYMLPELLLLDTCPIQYFAEKAKERFYWTRLLQDWYLL